METQDHPFISQHFSPTFIYALMVVQDLEAEHLLGRYAMGILIARTRAASQLEVQKAIQISLSFSGDGGGGGGGHC